MSGAEPRSRLNSGVRRGRLAEEVVEAGRLATSRRTLDGVLPEKAGQLHGVSLRVGQFARRPHFGRGLDLTRRP